MMPGPAVAEAFADLGVIQVATGRSAPALEDKRTDAGIQRFRRIARLPLPLSRRAQVTGCSGVCMTMYGAGQQHVSDERIARNRAANLAAVWRTPYRAVPELVFTALNLSWRADVLAVAAIQPWWFLFGLLAREEADAQELAVLLMLGGSERTGPIAAALAALRRAGVCTDLHHSRWVGEHGGVLEQPLEQPRGDS